MSNNDAIITMPIENEKSQYVLSAVELEEERQALPAVKRYQTGRRQLDRMDSHEESSVDVDGEEDTLKWLGRAYHKILNFNIVTRYLLYLSPVLFALSIPLIIFGTVAKNANTDGVRLFGVFIWLEIVWASLWFGKLCAKTLPYIFKFLCGMVTSRTRTYTELIRALELPLSFFVWVIVSWATVPVIGYFNMKDTGGVSDQTWERATWPDTLKRVLLASIPVAGVWFVEKIAIQVVAVNYHRTQFQHKLRENSQMIDIVTELYTASRTLFEPYCEEFMDEDCVINNPLVGSTTTSQARLVVGGLARVGNGVSSVFNSIATEVAGGRKLDPTSDKGVVVAALQKKASSAALGRRLWMSLAEDGKDALYERDIKRVLGEDRQHDAEKIFRSLDKDRNGDVSLEEMEAMLVAFETGQKAMIKSMHDVKSSVAALDRILMAVALVITGGIYAAFFSKNFLNNLAIATTSIMSFSFAFAGTVQEFAGSCIFIFVKHPYDVDDRVEIDGVEMIVKKVSLLYTIFHRIDTNRTVQIPNIINNANWIENVSRSGAMKERIQISIDASTSAEDIEALKNELRAFVRLPECKRDYQPLVLVDINAIGDFKSLELKVEYGHKSNWADETLRMTRRTKFLSALIATLRKLSISAPGWAAPSLGDRALPAYSVTVTDQEARAAKAEFDAAKAAARLANISTTTARERQASKGSETLGRRHSAFGENQ